MRTACWKRVERMRCRGQAPGLDGITYRDLGRSEQCDVIRAALRTVADRIYVPSRPRPVQIPKWGGGSRELLLRSIMDRIIAKTVLMAIMPMIDATLLDSTMGFRPQRGVWRLLAHLHHAVATTGYMVINQTDIKQAFPSVPIGLAIECYRRHIHDEGLLWLIETILRGHRGAAQTIGIEQGCPLSPLTLNIVMHYLLDLPLKAAGLEIPLWYRYADNLLYLSQSVSDGRQRLSQTRDLLTPAGFHLKHSATEHITLSRPAHGWMCWDTG